MLKVIIVLVLLLFLGYLLEPFMTSAWESIKTEIADESTKQQPHNDSPRPVSPQQEPKQPERVEQELKS